MDITLDNLATIRRALNVASESGLETEIILFTINEIKKNNNISIKQAILTSLGEWDLI